MKLLSISGGVVLFDSIAGGSPVKPEYDAIYSTLLTSGAVYARDVDIVTYSYDRLLKTSLDEIGALKDTPKHRSSYYLFKFGIRKNASSDETVTVFDINTPSTLKETTSGMKIPDYKKAGTSNVKRYTLDNGIITFLDKVRAAYVTTDSITLPTNVLILDGSGNSIPADVKSIENKMLNVASSGKVGVPSSFIRAYRDDIPASSLKGRLSSKTLKSLKDNSSLQLCFCELRYVENGFEVSLSDAIYDGGRLLEPSTIEVASHKYDLDNVKAAVSAFLNYVGDAGVVDTTMDSFKQDEMARIIHDNCDVKPPLSEGAIQSMYYAMKDRGFDLGDFTILVPESELFAFCNVCSGVTPHNKVGDGVFQCLFCTNITNEKKALKAALDKNEYFKRRMQNEALHKKLTEQRLEDQVSDTVDRMIKDPSEEPSKPIVRETLDEPELTIEEQADKFNLTVPRYRALLSKKDVFFDYCRKCDDMTPSIQKRGKSRNGDAYIGTKCEICKNIVWQKEDDL